MDGIRPYLERIFSFFLVSVPHPGLHNMRAVTSHGAPPRQPSSCPNTRFILRRHKEFAGSQQNPYGQDLSLEALLPRLNRVVK